MVYLRGGVNEFNRRLYEFIRIATAKVNGTIQTCVKDP